MVSRADRASGKVAHLSVNACLAPVVSMHGKYQRCQLNFAVIFTVFVFVEQFSGLSLLKRLLELSHGFTVCRRENIVKITAIFLKTLSRYQDTRYYGQGWR